VESLYFWKIANQSSSSTSSSLLSLFLSAPPCRPRRPCAEHLLPPRRSPLRHVPPQHPRRRSPPRAGPLRAPPHRAAIAPSCHARRRFASTSSRSLCLLLDLKQVLELPVHFLSPSRTRMCTVFFLPELHASPEPRHCLGSPSTAASAASHPRPSALTAPPPPTGAPQPVQFCSLAPERPDHYAGELELPPPLGLAVIPPLRRLSAPDEHPTSTTSSRRSCLATSPPPSGTPATGTPSTSLEAPPPTFAVDPPPRPFSSPTPATPVTVVSP
jgi:hypothetical protein